MFFPCFDETAFLRYVDGKAAEGALTKEINEEVIRIKEHKEMRREYMTLLMELQKYKTEGMQEGIEIGMKQGMEQGMEQWMEEKGRTVIVKSAQTEHVDRGHCRCDRMSDPVCERNRARSGILRLRRSHE